MDEKDKQIFELESQLHIFREALLRIYFWNLPKAYSWHDKKLMSFGYVKGSNGERDYFREIAKNALNSVDGKIDE